MERIVHLIFTLESGGSENMLVDIANEQASLANVTIILINNKYNMDIVSRMSQHVHFYSLQREEGSRRSIGFLFRLWTLLLKIRPHVIHCHNQNIIRLLPLYRNRAVITIHCLKAIVMHLKKYEKSIFRVRRCINRYHGAHRHCFTSDIKWYKLYQYFPEA